MPVLDSFSLAGRTALITGGAGASAAASPRPSGRRARVSR